MWIVEVWSENGCGKLHFWPEIGSGFGAPGGTSRPRLPRSNYPPTTPREKIIHVVIKCDPVLDRRKGFVSALLRNETLNFFSQRCRSGVAQDYPTHPTPIPTPTGQPTSNFCFQYGGQCSSNTCERRS